MNIRIGLTSFALLLVSILPGAAFAQDIRFEQLPKPRLLVLTDIENEPDDAMSLVRLLTYANVFDIEGLVATTSCWQRDAIADWRIHEIVDAYGKVRDNLETHESGYPTHVAIKSIIKRGIPVFGMNGVGEGHDSEGSAWLIAMVDKDDERPLWVNAWGGANVLAQALWKIRETRSAAELDKFVAKIRVYTISDQDDTGPWMRENFPGLFYIASPGYEENGGNSYHFATWVGISGDKFHGRFASPGVNHEIVDNPWLDENIRQNHGPLGAEHPHTEYLMEGDTPAFLHIIPNGLNDPEHPNHGGWGGRYESYTPAKLVFHYQQETRPLWTDALDEVTGLDGEEYTSNHATIWRWREGYQYDFAARIDWSNTPNYKDANHRPIAAIQGNTTQAIAHLNAKPGDTIKLSAANSTDPDGDTLTYKWIPYKEAGTLPIRLEIEGANTPNITLTIPNLPGTDSPWRSQGTLHIILQLNDNGTPNLYSYRRIIIDVTQ